ncbi:helix-turn-helix domain-containing protein [Fluviispira multicolorata]|uniref:Helix-turn-helix domain-containing protein n=1 Tax=Fluviispira multicolorata TaxID=2654512 RepID=A0A833JDG2_9BACT|nr:helix-turn-helix transcriptional regulator [Fluviispira multicolorata]KAB8030767.1 helix-turn-helix domain-containing protein [Fluviispira multicolorata]
MNITQAASANDKNALGVTYETANIVGSRLKQARENRRLSQSQVSARVKIRDRYIEAIEAGDWDVLPPGLNGRGLIRLYARELAVHIPEFESFQHLQTVRVERQSESLMSSTTKKSKYHPAAEESAEVIRSISRRDFQKVTGNEGHAEYAVPATGISEDVSQTRTYNRPAYIPQRPHSNAIVTPNAFEVLGIEVEEKQNYHPPQANYKSFQESALPRAEPVKRPVQENTYVAATESRVEVKITESEPIYHSRIDNTPESNDYSEEQITKKRSSVDMAPMRIVLGLAFFAIFGFITLFLSSKNTHQTKGTSLSAKSIESNIENAEPIPSSVVDPSIPTNKENKSVAEPSSQTQTVATGGMSISSQKVSNSMIIERTAKINVTSKVNIIVESDGKQIYSGIHPVGIFEIPFKQKAEITISDASKASLTYEGWDHGPLGYAGRKRKIILNAQPYAE